MALPSQLVLARNAQTPPAGFEEALEWGLESRPGRDTLAGRPLILQRLDERLRRGVVVRVAGSAHADRHAVLLEQMRVVLRSVLHPRLGVTDQSWHGRCRPRAMRSAESGRWSSSFRSSVPPITRFVTRHSK